MAAPILLRDGSETTDPRLDRLIQFDEKSREYPIRELLPSTKLVSRSWAAGPVLDQGKEGSCVGQAWTKDAACYPIPIRSANEPMAESVYRQAQTLDDFPDDTPYEGTSTIAGAKAMVSRGFITGYRWAFKTEEVLATLSNLGPVVIGIWWKDSMYQTLPNGLVTVEGPNVGGHCILLTGIFLKKQFPGLPKPIDVVEWTNSWGRNYGINGKGYLPFDMLDERLQDDGEACIPVGRRVPRAIR